MYSGDDGSMVTTTTSPTVTSGPIASLHQESHSINDNVHSHNQLGVSWLPTTMVVNSRNDHQQQRHLAHTYVINSNADSNSGGIFVEIPYQIVRSEGNLSGIRESVVNNNEIVSEGNLQETDHEVKFMVKFDESVCPLSVFGLENSSFNPSKIGETMDNLTENEASVSLEQSGNIDSKQATDACNDKNTSGFCSMCGKFIKDAAEMAKHIIYHQERSVPVATPGITCIDLSAVQRICPACGNSLRSLEMINQQEYQTIDQLSNVPMFTCDHCGKDYTLGISHEIGPNETDIYGAEQEYIDGSVISAYEYASALADQNKGNMPEMAIATYNSLNRRFACSLCEKTYKHNRDLRKHIRSRHAGSEEAALASVKTHRSSISSKSENSFASTNDSAQSSEMSTSLVLSRSSDQSQSSTPKLICSKCDRSFRGPFELRRHIKTVHENNRPFKCRSCPRSFRDAHELRRHDAGHQKPGFLHSQVHSINQSGGYVLNPPPLTSMKYGYVKREESLSYPGQQRSPWSLSAESLGTFPSSHIDSGNLDGIKQEKSPLEPGDDNVYSIAENSICRNFSAQSIQGASNIHEGANLETGIALAKHLPLPVLTGNDFFCTVCEKNFRGPNEFKRHYSVVHEKKYRYRCIHCNKLWRDQYDLKRHCKRSHFLDQDIDKAFIKSCLINNNPPKKSTEIVPSASISFQSSPYGCISFSTPNAALSTVFGSYPRNYHHQYTQMRSPSEINNPLPMMDDDGRTSISFFTESATMTEDGSNQLSHSLENYLPRDASIGVHSSDSLLFSDELVSRQNISSSDINYNGQVRGRVQTPINSEIRHSSISPVNMSVHQWTRSIPTSSPDNP